MSELIENKKFIKDIKEKELLKDLSPTGTFIVPDIEDDNLKPGDILTLAGVYRNKLTNSNTNWITGTVVKVGSIDEEACVEDGIRVGTRVMYPLKRVVSPMAIGSDVDGVSGVVHMVRYEDILGVLTEEKESE